MRKFQDLIQQHSTCFSNTLPDEPARVEEYAVSFPDDLTRDKLKQAGISRRKFSDRDTEAFKNVFQPLLNKVWFHDPKALFASPVFVVHTANKPPRPVGDLRLVNKHINYQERLFPDCRKQLRQIAGKKIY